MNHIHWQRLIRSTLVRSTLIRSASIGSLIVATATLALTGAAGQPATGPVQVEIADDKPVYIEAALPVDPTPRIRCVPSANFNVRINTMQGRSLHLSHFPLLNIDGRVTQAAAAGGRFEKINQPLPTTASGRKRQGHMTVLLCNDLRITGTMELAPSTSAGPGRKRQLDTVLIKYLVENIGKQSHKFGMRAYIDMYIVTNDGALFAAPTIPGKVLDGIELKDKTLPDWVKCLERPELKNPGNFAHLTLNLGSTLEKASRVVLSRHGAGGFNGWDMPAVRAMGDSALSIYFDPKEIKPGGRREFGYAYGIGVAVAPEAEGRVELTLDGSFEPGKEFTVTALVHDPVIGQALVLELPEELALLEGREIRPVPQPTIEPRQSFVEWKCTVRKLGRFPLRIRSSTGVTQTKVVTLSRGDG
ncbi:MAG: hypothetical protein L0Y71_10385 [Gemmataceae bacterium]|nr:hypothetical protein [Gemmataceae bacterium]